MKLRKVVLDTNLYIDWLNRGTHEALFSGPGLIRYFQPSCTWSSAQALPVPARNAPSTSSYARIAQLNVWSSSTRRRSRQPVWRFERYAGRESRFAEHRSNAVLIALSARAVGATLITADSDYEAIGSVVDFRCEHVVRS